MYIYTNHLSIDLLLSLLLIDKFPNVHVVFLSFSLNMHFPVRQGLAVA